MNLISYVLALQKKGASSFSDACLLRFLSWLEKLYTAGVRRRYKKDRADAYRADVPVISVGNIVAGGTGKTPCILAVAERLLRKGKHPAILSRGYRSRLENIGGMVSDGKSLLLSQEDAGDEPYMMAIKMPSVPVFIGRNRVASAKKAVAGGADVLLLDDGFQYWRLERDRDLVLIDCTNPFGYDHVLPRGLLREPPDALARGDVFILTKSDHVEEKEIHRIKTRILSYAPQAVFVESRHVLTDIVCFSDWKSKRHASLAQWQGKRVILLTAIGNPDAFRETAARFGLHVMGTLFLPDHHVFTDRDLHHAEAEARACGADGVVMTEKDGVKCLHLEAVSAMSPLLYVAEMKMMFTAEGESVFDRIEEEIE